MSENCKEIEERAKKEANNPIVAKDLYLQTAECYEKKYNKKKTAKAYEKVAQIACDIASQFEDPEEAQKFYEEAKDYYKKIKKTKEIAKCTHRIANHYVTTAKSLHNSKKRIIYAIKYLQIANKILRELDQKDKVDKNQELIETIQKEIGLPMKEISSILEEFPKLPMIRRPPILEQREIAEMKKAMEEEKKLAEKDREKAKRLEEKEKEKEELAKQKQLLEKKQEYEKAVLQKLVKEGKSAEEIKKYKEELAELEQEEKSQLAALDQLFKKKEG